MKTIQFCIVMALYVLTPFSLIGMEKATLCASAAHVQKSSLSFDQVKKIAVDCASYLEKRTVAPSEILGGFVTRMQMKIDKMESAAFANEDNLYDEYMKIYKEAKVEHEKFLEKQKEIAAAQPDLIIKRDMTPPAPTAAASAHAWESAAAEARPAYEGVSAGRRIRVDVWESAAARPAYEDMKARKRYVLVVAAVKLHNTISSPKLTVIDSDDRFFVLTRSTNLAYERSEYTYKLSGDGHTVYIFKK